MRCHVFATAFGHVAIAWRGTAIASLRLPAACADEAETALHRHLPQAIPGEPPAPIAATVAAIMRYFDGERVDFAAVAVDLGKPSSFAARVYASTRSLGWGETTACGAVARDLGFGPEAARAVGRAMATNPVPLIVPCHRVLGANGAIGGFSAPGGVATKERMLALEGATTDRGQQAFAF